MRGHAVNPFPDRSRRPASDHGRLKRSEHQPAALMAAIAATLAVMSLLHLTGSLGGDSKSFDGAAAGIAEAVLCVVLGYGTAALLRNGPAARPIALASTGLAIVGFLIGVSFTLRGGSVIDVAYHLGSLPILILALIALLRMPGADQRRTHPGAPEEHPGA